MKHDTSLSTKIATNCMDDQLSEICIELDQSTDENIDAAPDILPNPPVLTTSGPPDPAHVSCATGAKQIRGIAFLHLTGTSCCSVGVLDFTDQYGWFWLVSEF
jgi:hypothetical protein